MSWFTAVREKFSAGSARPDGSPADGPLGAEQLLAQGAGRIALLHHAARLQFRHHQGDEILDALRHHRARQVEAVDVGFVYPGLQLSATRAGEPTIGAWRLPSTIISSSLRGVHSVSRLRTVIASRPEAMALVLTKRIGSSGP